MSNSVTGLRSRLIILVLTAVIPAFALIVHSADRYRDLTAAQIKQNVVIGARAIASEQDRILENAHEFLVTLSRVPQIREQNRGECRRILAGLLEPRFADLVLADRTGNPLCTALSKAQSVALPGGKHHRRSVEGHDFAVGDIRRDGSGQRALLDVSYPVLKSPGVVRAVVSAVINLSWINRVAVDAHLQPGATFTLLTANGEVLLRYPEGDQWRGKRLFQGPATSSKEATIEAVGPDGLSRLIGISRLKNSLGGETVYAAVDLPLEKAFSKTRVILQQQLFVLGVLVVLILAVTWFGTDALVLRRIRDIITATSEMAAGNLRARTTLGYDASELGQMARSFDHLAEALEKREAEAAQAAKQLHQQRQQQEALYDLNRGITSTLDIASVLSILLDHISLLFSSYTVTVSWIDSQSRNLETIARRNWTNGVPAAASASVESLPKLILQRQSPVTLLDDGGSSEDDLLLLRREGWAFYLGLPLQVKTEVLGVLSFYSRDTHEFSADEITFLNALVNEAAIAIHNSQLFEQTRQQAAELEKSNKIKDEFLGVMSHELRTPLNIIMNYSEALRMGTFGEIDPDQARGIEKIRLQAGQLLSLINGILEITKIESGSVSLDKQPLDLNGFIAELRSDYLLSCETGVELLWQSQSGLPTLVTDRIKLKQIVTNLINNAIKFTAQGTVTVSAGVSANRDEFAIQVADTGPGIPKELLPFVFDKFRQIDSATTRNYSGAGLGLYIVKNFVALLGGAIEVSSNLGKGSVFAVKFPLESIPQSDNTPASRPDSPASPS